MPQLAGYVAPVPYTSPTVEAAVAADGGAALPCEPRAAAGIAAEIVVDRVGVVVGLLPSPLKSAVLFSPGAGAAVAVLVVGYVVVSALGDVLASLRLFERLARDREVSLPLVIMP